MAAPNQSTIGKAWTKFLNYFGIGRDGGQAGSTTTKAKWRDSHSQRNLGDVALSFGTFIAVRLPDMPPSGLAGQSAIENFTVSLAKNIRDGLSKFGLDGCELIEMYMPSETETTM